MIKCSNHNGLREKICIKKKKKKRDKAKERKKAQMRESDGDIFFSCRALGYDGRKQYERIRQT